MKKQEWVYCCLGCQKDVRVEVGVYIADYFISRFFGRKVEVAVEVRCVECGYTVDYAVEEIELYQC